MHPITSPLVRDQETARATADLDRATLAIRTHCSISWPHGVVCLNCSERFPCGTRQRASMVLCNAGWTEEAINKLDSRTGPWS
jgi:hypothetical protein